MSGKKSRNKGACAEREAAKVLGDILGIPMSRSAMNGVESADDIIGWDGVHVEVKRRSSIAAARFMGQSKEDSAPFQIPTVMMREDRGEWLLMCRVDDLMKLAERVAKVQGRPVYPTEA